MKIFFKRCIALQTTSKQILLKHSCESNWIIHVFLFLSEHTVRYATLISMKFLCRTISF